MRRLIRAAAPRALASSRCSACAAREKATAHIRAQEPELVHRDPYGAGWIARLRPLRWDEERPALVTGAAIAPAMRRHAWLMRQADSPGADISQNVP